MDNNITIGGLGGSGTRMVVEIFQAQGFFMGNDLIDSLDLNELDNNQRIKMLQIALQYTLPKLKQETDEVEDLPLFID